MKLLCVCTQAAVSLSHAREHTHKHTHTHDAVMWLSLSLSHTHTHTHTHTNTHTHTHTHTRRCDVTLSLSLSLSLSRTHTHTTAVMWLSLSLSLSLSHTHTRNTQCLPDMTVSTLLRLLKPRLLSLCEHLGGIKQIFPHRDIDMWGRVWISCFRGRGTVLTLIKNLFGFETLVFATLGILSMHEQLVTLQRERKTWNRIIGNLKGKKLSLITSIHPMLNKKPNLSCYSQIIFPSNLILQPQTAYSMYVNFKCNIKSWM